MITSFKEFIEEKYFDIIYEKLRWYIYNNRTTIPFRLKRIDTVHQAWLEDAYFKHFYVHDYLDDIIGISIIMETNVTLKQSKDGDCIDDYDYHWFLVKCQCRFQKQISNFKVTSINSYDGLDKEKFGLTDNLIPYIKKDRLDSVAEEILKRKYPQALEGSPVNPYEFASGLGLSIKEVIFKDPNQMGAIYFKKYISINKNGEKKITAANTIKISKNSSFLGFERCKNFTIMHECVHYILHKKAFQLEQLFNKKAKSIECLADGSGKTGAKQTAIDWMEWQANNLAPRLLMPVEPFKKKVHELINKYHLNFDSDDCLDYYEKIMYDLSDFYGSPLESVKIRLIEIGYEFPLGCFISIDGAPVLPHSFRKGSLCRNETFSIGLQDAAVYTFKEKYLCNNNLIDEYVYIDSHLCINHPKYVIKNALGILELSFYARHHMDECCIKFEIDVPKEIGHYEMNYKTFKMLSRKKGNSAEVVIKAYNSFNSATSKNSKAALEEAFRKENELVNKIPRTANGCFKVLREYSGYKLEELYKDSGLSKSTIDDYLYKENHKYTIAITVRLLLFMNIPPKASELVLDLCNCKLNNNITEHQWIDFVLRHRWLYKFEDNIDFLIDKKIYL